MSPSRGPKPPTVPSTVQILLVALLAFVTTYGLGQLYLAVN